MLAGGLYGMDQKIAPPPMVTGNAYDIPADEAEQVPGNLEYAIKLFQGSAPAREYFGDKFVEYYAEFKNCEYRQFCSHVTEWEKMKYLEMA